MTGDHVFGLTRALPASDAPSGEEHGHRWRRLNMKHRPTAEEPRKAVLVYTDEAYDTASLWELLCEYHDNEALLAASLNDRRSSGESKRPDGLVTGHAYSLIRVVETAAGFRLVQLRNPWGRFEWTGAWSDASPLWDEHPAVTLELRPERQVAEGKTEDGTFWMDFESFCATFTDLECCDRSTGLHDLALSVDSDAGACGPCLGCCHGCVGYWLLCRGCRALYFAHESGYGTRTVTRGCGNGCLTCLRRVWAAFVTVGARIRGCCCPPSPAPTSTSQRDLV